MALGWQNIGIYCTDPGPLARWWAELLLWRITFEDEDEVAFVPDWSPPRPGR